MAKILQTRIKNRFDSLTNWNKEGVELLQGEIALVKVETQQLDATTGKVVNVPAFLLKVGENDSNGNPKAFSALPWLSAKAADVYDWAKEQYAKDINVTVLTGSSNTAATKTLGEWLKVVYDNGVTNTSSISANTQNIAANTAAIETLNKGDSVSGSVAYKIKAAIDALDVSTTSGSGTFVKTVTQTNGKIAVTMGTIAESELPNIGAGKILVDSSTTLTTKLGTVDQDIADLKARQVGHTDAQINTLIDNKINELDVSEPTASGTSTSFIATAKQENGKIVVTKSNLPTASTSVAGIAKLGATGGAATYDAVDALTDRVDAAEEDIADIKTAITGGVHFIGTVAAKPTTAAVTVNGSKSVTAVAGDVVIWTAEGIEYIYTGSAWEELGDVDRVGALETKINDLDVTATNAVASTHKFVSQVTQTDGKIAVTYTQPTAADVSYGTSSTVNAELASHAERVAAVEGKLDGVTKVTTSITNAINALDVAEPAASGTATSFIATAKQEDGKIVVTKASLPTSSTSLAGIVKLSSATNSTSEALAATPKAVKDAYDKGADAQERVAAVEGNYMRIGTDDKLYAGKSGTEVIIFDCGGAI